jgi:uncharacterized protein with NRDE domain
MCTLIVRFDPQATTPVLVAANRDELRDRPAEGPRRWPGKPFVAPRDVQAGGTWLGLTTSGLFVGVTNRALVPREPARASRGALVVEALQQPSAAAVHAALRSLPAHRLNAFHLLYADAREAFVTWSDGAQVRQTTLPVGLTVVSERAFGGDDAARVGLITSAWATLPREGDEPTSEGLMGLLGRTNPGDPFGGVCVDAPEWNYGTRSSLVLRLARDRARSRFFWAEGRPDVTPFVERPDLVASLFERAP